MAELDVEALRRALEDYYGTVWASGLGMAVADLANVGTMSEAELVRRAREVGLNPDHYERRRKHTC